MTPAIGARLGLAAALAQAGRPAEGLAVLDALPVDRTAMHQPYWAVRADLHARLGRKEDASQAYGRAIALSNDAAVRAFLKGRMARLQG
jgi:RNA polymerase sigma-70 factor (ECF subfamily)